MSSKASRAKADKKNHPGPKTSLGAGRPKQTPAIQSRHPKTGRFQ